MLLWLFSFLSKVLPFKRTCFDFSHLNWNLTTFNGQEKYFWWVLLEIVLRINSLSLNPLHSLHYSTRRVLSKLLVNSPDQAAVQIFAVGSVKWQITSIKTSSDKRFSFKCLMFYCKWSVCNLIQQFSYKNLKNFGWKCELSDAIVSSKL